jgi:oligopeptide/dipeptide ABC transporter ATP-binding protein
VSEPRRAPDAPLIQVGGLKKHFVVHGATVRAVDGVSFQVWPGETVAVVGESGCGKSTTARCLVRLLDPNDGEIHFKGTEIGRMSKRDFRPLRKDIQMVFQDPHASLNPSLSVRRTLLEPLTLHGIATRKSAEQRLEELMRLVQLDPTLLDHKPDQLSGGQKQRVGIARAIASDPEFVVLDEPTSSLDVSLQSALLALLTDLQRQLGMTYLFITHDFSTVRQLADRVVVMYLGRVVETGPMADILDAPKHPYTQALISAIPVPDPHRRRARAALQGETPGATAQLSGCPFQDRCPHVMDACRTGSIPFFKVGRQEVACLLYDDHQEISQPGTLLAAPSGQ